MTPLWKNRTRNLAAAFGVVTLAAAGLAIILSAAHDATGAQAAAGAAVVTGLAFLGAILVLAADAVWSDLPPRS
jgi:hypothetical protein